MMKFPPCPAVLLLAMTACASPHAGDAGGQPLAGVTPAQRPCPDWSRGSAEDFSNRTASNFGCADATNFHAQLARPQDAVQGRGGATGAADGAVTAIDRMRNRPAVGAPDTGASGTAAAMPEPRP